MKKIKKILILLFILLLTLPTQVFAGTYYPDYNLPNLDYGSYRELKSQSNNNYEQWLGYNIEEYPGYSIVKFRVYAATTNASFYWAEDYDIWAVNSSGQTVAEDWFRDSTCDGSSCSRRGSGGTWYKYTNGSMDLRIDGAGYYTIYIEDNPYDNQQVSTIGRLSFGITVKPATVQLSYNGNGATSGSVATATVNQNTNTTVANNGYAKTGYLFKNWNLNSVGTSTAYNPGNSIYMDSSKTLYAQWNPISYTINFNGNGADSGTMSSITATYDTNTTLTRNQFSKVGYTFLNWNTNPSGTSSSYADQATVRNLTSTNGDTINLYAQWTANPYTISIDANGGKLSNGLGQDTINATYDQTYNIANPTRRGYTFLGWTVSGMDSSNHYIDGVLTNATQIDKTLATQYKNLTSVKGGSVNLKANWVANKYSITFSPENGLINGLNQNVVYEVIYDSTNHNNVSELVTTREGWEFFGWYSQKQNIIYQVGDSAPTTNQIYYANGSNANDGEYWRNDLWYGLTDLTVYAHWKDVTKPNITIEQYQPEIYKGDGSLNYTNTDVIVSISLGDNESGLDRLEVVTGSGNIVKTYNYDALKAKAETYTAEFRIMPEEGWLLRVYDKAGNYSETPLAVPTIDKVPPEFDQNNLSCGLTLHPQYMTIAIRDDYSGIDHWKYAIAYTNEFNETQIGEWVDMPGTQLTANIDYPESLYGYIEVVAYDKAGNEATIHGCSFNYAKQYTSDTKLIDFSYIFAKYRSSYGSVALTDSVADEFIVWLQNDDNEASKAALKYIERKVKAGHSKVKAIELFLSNYGYSDN